MPVSNFKQIALTQNASVLVAAPNPMRKFIGFANTDANNIIYVANSNTDGINGFPVMPRSYVGFEATSDKVDPTVTWYCYTTAANLNINVMEGFGELILAVTKTQSGKLVPKHA